MALPTTKRMPTYGKTIPPLGWLYWWGSARPPRVPLATVTFTQSIIDEIVAARQRVNHRFFYVDSPTRLAKDWETENEFGDCRAFAFAYRKELIEKVGLSPGAVRLATCYAQGVHHAVCTIEELSSGTYFLDLRLHGLREWQEPGYDWEWGKRQRPDRFMWEKIGHSTQSNF